MERRAVGRTSEMGQQRKAGRKKARVPPHRGSAAAAHSLPHGGDDFVASLKEIFAAELKEHLEAAPAQLRLLASPATRAVACQQLNRIFHTIKGSAGMVGRSDIAKSALRLELFFGDTSSLQGPDMEPAQVSLQTLFGSAGLEAPSLMAVLGPPPAPKATTVAFERELVDAFVGDAAEGLRRCEELLLKLEKQPRDRDIMRGIFRHFHTIKGAAASVGLQAIATRFHEAESLLEEMLLQSTMGGEGPSEARDGVNRLFEFTGQVERQIRQAIDLALREDAVAAASDSVQEGAALVSAAEGPAPGGEAEGITGEPDAGFIRVAATQLDALMEEVSALALHRLQMEKRINMFGDLREKLRTCCRRLVETAEGFERRVDDPMWMPRNRDEASSIERDGSVLPVDSPAVSEEEAGDELFTDLEFDKYDDATVLSRCVIELATDSGEIADELGGLIESLGEQARGFSKITADLQRQITSLRLVPLDSVFRRLQRPVRDAARQAGVRVELELRGGEVSLDRGVIEALHAPLLHLVRNAVCHGIEAPEVREARGKPRVGTVRITASPQSHGVLVAVSDDGRGLDLHALLVKARAQRLLADDEVPSREQLLRLIFRPGFTTATTADDLAGRGVGLDVVARQIASLSGSVMVEFEPGKGTSFQLQLPITTSIDETLLVEIGKQVFAVPIRFVEQAMPMEMTAIQEGDGKPVLPCRDRQVPVLLLASLVGETAPADSAVAVLLRVGDKRIGLVVDRVREQQEVAIRSLNPVLEAHPFLSGTTISGSGAVIFVLHVGRLIDLMSDTSGFSPVVLDPEDSVLETTIDARRAVLLVDDSISVRKLAAHFLEQNGVDADTAVDGLDALEKLTRRSYRVVVTDLEMPRMHGYELIEEMKRHPYWRELPIIVCTSRTSEKHRRRARELGAEGYITKPFTGEELVAEITRVTEYRPASELLAESASQITGV